MEMSRQRGNGWDPEVVAAWLQVKQHTEDGGAKVRAVVGRVTALRVALTSWYTQGHPVQRRGSHLNQTGETEATLGGGFR